MSDLHEVESTLRSVIAQVIYPNGTSQPSVAGLFTKIIRGWPQPQQIDADLKAGKVTVSVFPQDNESRTTRYPQEWQELSHPVSSLILTAGDTTITVSGAPSSPLNAAATVNSKTYIYPVQPGDTTDSIAARLAALIAADTTATSSGPVVSIPYAHALSARVGSVGTIIRELRRQKRGFQVTCWCPDPDSRDATASAIDNALAQVDFLALPDGTAGRLLYERSHVEDGSQEEILYRRDLFYSVEYGTTQTQDAAEIVDVVLNYEDWQGNPLPGHLTGDRLKLESGGYILTEDGRRIILG